MQPFKIAVLIMAAGESRRFKSCKLLSKIDEKTILGRAIEYASRVAVQHVYYIVGAYYDAIIQSHHSVEFQQAKIIKNPQWEQGLLHSIGVGIHAIINQADTYDGVLILHADQVAITDKHLQQMIAQFNGDNIVSAFYENQPMVPVLIAQSFFPKLLAFIQQNPKQKGAKQFLWQQQQYIVKIPMLDAAIDIDTLEDLQEWRCKDQLKS